MKKTPFVRNPYNYDVDEASNEAGLACKDKSRTIHSQAQETNINEIVRKFHLTGELPQNVRLPTYGDFTGINSFHEAANAIAQANEQFDMLPAHIRARFHNDPGEFVEFCSNEDNAPELVKMGLASVRQDAPEDPLHDSIQELTSTLRETAGTRVEPSDSVYGSEKTGGKTRQKGDSTTK